MFDPPSRPPPRLRRWAYAVAVVLILAAIAVAVWWMVRGPELESGIKAMIEMAG